MYQQEADIKFIRAQFTKDLRLTWFQFFPAAWLLLSVTLFTLSNLALLYAVLWALAVTAMGCYGLSIVFLCAAGEAYDQDKG